MIYDVSGSDAVCAIFHGNEKLNSTVPEDVFQDICNLNEEHGPSSKFLSILKTVVAPRNKHVILKILLDSCNEDTLLLCNKPNSPMYEERVKWITGNEEQKEKLEYHITLVTIMARCDSGFDLFAEAKCQQLYPVEHVMFALLDRRHNLELKTALGRYFYEVSLEADIKSSTLQQSEQMWNILEDIAIFFENTKFFEVQEGAIELQYCLYSALPVVSGFFHHYYENQSALTRHQLIAVRVVTALKETDFFTACVPPLQISDTAKNDLKSLPTELDMIVTGTIDPSESELVIAPEIFHANEKVAGDNEDEDHVQIKYKKQLEVLEKDLEVKNLVKEEMKRLVWYIENVEAICKEVRRRMDERWMRDG